MYRHVVSLVGLVVLFSGGCAAAQPAPVAAARAPVRAWHLHLPGISGYRSIDRHLIEGLVEGGLNADVQPYDWTTADPGLGSLLAYKRNQDEAGKVAQTLVAHYRKDPTARVTITAHSGGCGIAAWALERLPAGWMVGEIVFFAPA